jgi:16S rRNA (guanine527-N7)-methyltransferase
MSEVEPVEAARVFSERLPVAARFAALLRDQGLERGVIGPREVGRLWDRHLLNSAVIAERIPTGAAVADIGAGGGFPGVPLAIARPDLTMTLIEPMARRVQWLAEVVSELELDHVEVVRGRAEERGVRDALAPQDVVTARAVAPMAKLAAWCLPLARDGGRLLAIKGATAEAEVDRDRKAIAVAGGVDVEVVHCGVGVLQTPTTVVSVRARRS